MLARAGWGRARARAVARTRVGWNGRARGMGLAARSRDGLRVMIFGAWRWVAVGCSPCVGRGTRGKVCGGVGVCSR